MDIYRLRYHTTQQYLDYNIHNFCFVLDDYNSVMQSHSYNKPACIDSLSVWSTQAGTDWSRSATDLTRSATDSQTGG